MVILRLLKRVHSDLLNKAKIDEIHLDNEDMIKYNINRAIDKQGYNLNKLIQFSNPQYQVTNLINPK